MNFSETSESYDFPKNSENVSCLWAVPLDSKLRGPSDFGAMMWGREDSRKNRKTAVVSNEGTTNYD